MALLCTAPAAQASETLQYSYDALGRLVQVTHGGPISQGATATYQYDKADNRANVTVVTSWTSKAYYAGDFNGDGRSDLLLRDDLGNITNWLGTAAGGFSNNNDNAAVYLSPDWTIVEVGDFNGDGRSDLLLRSSAGWVTEWLGATNGGFTDNGAIATTFVSGDWKVAGVADFNGDGKADVLWRRDDGWLTGWVGTSTGAFVDNGSNWSTLVGPEWKVAGTGDFNGDGISDIIWRRSTDNWVYEWLGSAAGFTGNDAASLGTTGDWKIVGIGKFNNDARSDILWRNDNGDLGQWTANSNGSFTSNSSAYYTNISSAWRVAAIGNFDGAGSSDDIVLRTANGDLTDWLGTPSGAFTGNNANAYSGLATNWNIEPK